MVLVDTSVWIDHFRKADPLLARLLRAGAVASHGCVIGELALGHLRERATILELLQALPSFPTLSDASVLEFVRDAELAGTGVGWVDAHLLAAVNTAREGRLLTADTRLRSVAMRLGLFVT